MVGRNLFTVLYVVATAICVGISVYLSYYGYYSHLQEVTLFFALLLGLLLFGTDMIFRAARIEGRRIWVPLGFFLLVLPFSWASNYNFLYTSFMERDIAERTFVAQYQRFRDDLTTTRKALRNHPEISEVETTRRALERELESLYSQVTDPLRPGCGERCRGHVAAISELLEGRLTDLALPPVDASAEQNEAWFAHYRETVTAAFEAGIDDTYHRALDLVEQIGVLLERYHDLDAVLEEAYRQRQRALVETRDFTAMAELRSHSNEVERAANALLPSAQQRTHSTIESDLDKLGEISVSIKDGFGERPSPGVTAVSVLLALFVDLAPILFAWLIFRPDGGKVGSAPRPWLPWRKRGRVATP